MRLNFHNLKSARCVAIAGKIYVLHRKFITVNAAFPILRGVEMAVYNRTIRVMIEPRPIFNNEIKN